MGCHEIKTWEWRCEKYKCKNKDIYFGQFAPGMPDGWTRKQVGPCGSHYGYYRTEYYCPDCSKEAAQEEENES